MGTGLERMPLCSAIMQIDRHTAYFSTEDPQIFSFPLFWIQWLVRPQSPVEL